MIRIPSSAPGRWLYPQAEPYPWITILDQAVASSGDTASLTLTETSSLISSSSRTDTASLTLAEVSTLLSTSSRTDTASLTLTEAVTLVSTLSRTDTASLTLTEASALAKTDFGLSGGFLHYYDRYSSRRIREHKKREADAREASSIQDETDAAIARLLHEQARRDAERADGERLVALAKKFAGRAPDVPPGVAKALLAVKEKQTLGSLQALQREVERMQDEEDFAVLMLMASED